MKPLNIPVDKILFEFSALLLYDRDHILDHFFWGYQWEEEGEFGIGWLLKLRYFEIYKVKGIKENLLNVVYLPLLLWYVTGPTLELNHVTVAHIFSGIGGESLAVAQNTFAVAWFKGKELNMVFGFQVSFSLHQCSVITKKSTYVQCSGSAHVTSWHSGQLCGTGSGRIGNFLARLNRIRNLCTESGSGSDFFD
jgi:hypothetical protein